MFRIVSRLIAYSCALTVPYGSPVSAPDSRRWNRARLGQVPSSKTRTERLRVVTAFPREGQPVPVHPRVQNPSRVHRRRGRVPHLHVIGSSGGSVSISSATNSSSAASSHAAGTRTDDPYFTVSAFDLLIYADIVALRVRNNPRLQNRRRRGRADHVRLR